MRGYKKWLIGSAVVIGLAGWGLTNAVQKVRLAAARTDAI